MQDALTVAFGPFTLDTVKLRLAGPHGEVQLSPLATRLFVELARTPGETIERSTLISALWRDDPLVADAALNRLVSEARQAIGDDPKNPRLIQTVPRRGYRLVALGDASPSAPNPLDRAAEVANRISYAKLAIVAGLIVLATVAIKVVLDTLIGVLAVVPR